MGSCIPTLEFSGLSDNEIVRPLMQGGHGWAMFAVVDTGRRSSSRSAPSNQGLKSSRAMDSRGRRKRWESHQHWTVAVVAASD